MAQVASFFIESGSDPFRVEKKFIFLSIFFNIQTMIGVKLTPSTLLNASEERFQGQLGRFFICSK